MGQLILGSPARNPSLDVRKRYSEACPCKIVQASAIFADIRAGKIYDRIEQGNGFGQHRSNILPALPRHLAKTRVGISIDLKRTIDEVHDDESNIYRGSVEARLAGHRGQVTYFAAGDIAGGGDGGPLADGWL